MGFPRQVLGRDRPTSPVPEGVRVGDWLFSSLLGPVDLTNGVRTTGDSAAEDARLLFKRIQDLLDAAGASPDHILEMAVYVMDDADRDSINVEWGKMFPDPGDRPARHILNVAPNGLHWRCAATITCVLEPPDRARLGKLVYSPMIIGAPNRSALGEVETMFDNLRTWIEGESGNLDNIASLMVYLMDDDRDTVNVIYENIFPDPKSRPARQTLITTPSGLLGVRFGTAAIAVL